MSSLTLAVNTGCGKKVAPVTVFSKYHLIIMMIMIMIIKINNSKVSP